MVTKRPIMSRWAFNFQNWNPSESDLLLATSCIQQEEKDRIQKFVFKKDFKSSLIGRLLLRKFVQLSTGIAYDQIRFDRDPKGKPILRNHVPSPLAFNVSHQGNYAVLAGESGRTQIGVDVMKMEYTGGKDLSEFFRIMNKNFAAAEWNNIRGCNEKEEIQSFFRHWCLKESYVKAIGVGITIPLQDICFNVKGEHGTELWVEGKKLNWNFEEMVVGGDHCVAVATNNDEGVVGKTVFKELSFGELMDGAIPLLEPDWEYVKSYLSKLQR